MIDLCKFIATYHIAIIHSWMESGLFSDEHTFIITDRGSGGITTEEKARLIEENFSKHIKQTFEA